MTKLDKYLKEVQERCDSATEGPWRLDFKKSTFDYRKIYEGSREEGYPLAKVHMYNHDPSADKNARFIAHSRQDVEVQNKIIKKAIAIILEQNKLLNLHFRSESSQRSAKQALKDLETLVPKEGKNEKSL